MVSSAGYGASIDKLERVRRPHRLSGLGYESLPVRACSVSKFVIPKVGEEYDALRADIASQESWEVTMRVLLLSLSIVVALSLHSKAAVDQHPLVGIWKLVSFQLIVDNGKPQALFGEHPKGYLILTAEGRMMTLATSDTRKPSASDAERAELWKSMFAYTGQYRIEGGDFVTTVDVSWNEEWSNTEQRRHYKLEGNKLTIVTVTQPSPLDKRPAYAKLVWEREK